MQSFDIGWSPPGWVRGNPLGFINNGFHGGDVAALYYKLAFGAEIPGIGAVQFRSSETSKVNAWLKWWYENGVTV